MRVAVVDRSTKRVIFQISSFGNSLIEEVWRKDTNSENEFTQYKVVSSNKEFIHVKHTKETNDAHAPILILEATIRNGNTKDWFVQAFDEF